MISTIYPERDMETVLGIDGGGTKTAAVILNRQGRVLGYGVGGPSTYGVVPVEVTRASIAEAVQAAEAAGDIGSAPYAAVFLGLGNVVSEMDRSAVHEVAYSLGLAERKHIGVDHDIRIALAGGLSGRPGIVIIAGTGSSCFGVNAAGDSWRSGGWGPLIDDEGSSYWLGIQAMRVAVFDYDGRGKRTLLTQSVCDRLAITCMDDLMNRLYADEMSRTEIAALAPLVFHAAGQGDAVAKSIIRRGCEALADCAHAVARRIGLETGSSELAVTGGQVNAGEQLLVPLREAVAQRLPACEVKEAELIPAVGAALLALRKLGQQVDSEVIASVEQNWAALEQAQQAGVQGTTYQK